MVGVSVDIMENWLVTVDFVGSVVTLVLTVADTDGDADNDAAADNVMETLMFPLDNVAIVTDAEDDCERVK